MKFFLVETLGNVRNVYKIRKIYKKLGKQLETLGNDENGVKTQKNCEKLGKIVENLDNT